MMAMILFPAVLGLLVGLVVGGALGLWLLVCLASLLHRVGRPPFYAFVPIVNGLEILRLARRPWWWLLLMLLPGVNLLLACDVGLQLADRFGYSRWFGLGLVFLAPICWAWLAFRPLPRTLAEEAAFLPARSLLL